MPNLKLTLAYDGTGFHGWQIQPGVVTVQGEVEQAIGRILGQSVSIDGSGRTDAGVHAQGQVVSFRTDRTVNIDAFHRGLNALLPASVRVRAIEEVGEGFHARLSARSKTYAYRIWRSPVVSPFHARYVHSVWQDLDSEKMDQASALFVGTHDFTSFSAASATVRSHVREVYSANWDRGVDEWVFRIRANGFLRAMVRTIVGTVIEIGRGRIAPEDIPAILAAQNRQGAGPSAPSKGLHLISVEY